MFDNLKVWLVNRAKWELDHIGSPMERQEWINAVARHDPNAARKLNDRNAINNHKRNHPINRQGIRRI